MTKKVLFVCSENSGRSLLAEALFNAMAPSGWTAISAGVTPAKAANTNALKALEEMGISVEGLRPKPIDEAALEEAQRIITVCGVDFCPVAHLAKVEQWEIEELKGKPIEEVRRVRDRLREKVEDLIQRIEAGG